MYQFGTRFKKGSADLKKIIAFVLIFSFALSRAAFAFDISGIKPDDSFVSGYGRDTNADISYLESIANSYNERFVVEKKEYIDTSPVDSFYANLFAPLTLSEIDSGKADFSLDKIYMSEDYRRKLNMCKVLGGLSGYSAEFEPIAFYSIHRKISLIGGYVDYKKSYENADDAYWQYVCIAQDMTKEVIPYETRLKLLDKEREFFDFIQSSRVFIIFLISDGSVDGIYIKD